MIYRINIWFVSRYSPLVLQCRRQIVLQDRRDITQCSDKRIVAVQQRVLKDIDSPSPRYFTYKKKVAYVIISANGCETRAWWGSSSREDKGKNRRAISITRGFKPNASRGSEK